MAESDRPAWTASVVVPAHDEAAVIGRCLGSLVDQRCAAQLRVVVVANGCRDRTVEVARGYGDRLPGLLVEDLAEPGKTGALNAGDALATASPVVFLDADIELPPGVLDDLVDTLCVDPPRVAAPAVRFDTTGASRAVRAFYRAFGRLPYSTTGLVGLGVYGLNAAGRARFTRFPELTADDLFVQRLFTPEERVTSPGEFVVRTPRSLDALVRVRTRVAYGNAQLARTAPVGADVGSTTAGTLRALLGHALRRPATAFDAVVYVAVTLRARRAARRPEARAWQRDQTSR